MTPRPLALSDHEMHDLRNRALQCVLASVLRAEMTRVVSAGTRALARRSRQSPMERMTAPARTARARRSALRLVKG